MPAWNSRARRLTGEQLPASRVRWRVQAAAFVVACVVLVPFLLLIAFISYEQPIEPEPFDSVRWKAAPLYGADATRPRMLPDLVRSHPLVGMTVEQVHGLLGEQSDPDYFRG
jgi:hypothetical protein